MFWALLARHAYKKLTMNEDFVGVDKADSEFIQRLGLVHTSTRTRSPVAMKNCFDSRINIACIQGNRYSITSHNFSD